MSFFWEVDKETIKYYTTIKISWLLMPRMGESQCIANQKKTEDRFRSLNLCASMNETFKRRSKNVLGIDT